MLFLFDDDNVIVLADLFELIEFELLLFWLFIVFEFEMDMDEDVDDEVDMDDVGDVLFGFINELLIDSIGGVVTDIDSNDFDETLVDMTRWSSI